MDKFYLREQHEDDRVGATVSAHFKRDRARDRAKLLEHLFPGRDYTVRTRRFRVPRYGVQRIG